MEAKLIAAGTIVIWLGYIGATGSDHFAPRNAISMENNGPMEPPPMIGMGILVSFMSANIKMSDKHPLYRRLSPSHILCLDRILSRVPALRKGQIRRFQQIGL